MVIPRLGNSQTEEKEGTRLANYEIGITLGTGSFAKVKLAKHIISHQLFALKIIDKNKIVQLDIAHQIKEEIATLKLLKHPNIVRLHEAFFNVPGVDMNYKSYYSTSHKLAHHSDFVPYTTPGSRVKVLASKTKIYMVLEYVNGGELFDRIASKGRLKEAEGRKLFQQLMDGVSYCHNIGVFHRDLKLENVLVDAQGNIKITDFGLSALPQHIRADGLLHTTCGSPSYVAPEVLANRGYDGATSDTWSCGVILFVILTGNLPFEDRNIVVLYQKISKGDVRIPKWLSPAAQNLLRRILDPNPLTRITLASIKEDEWFRQDHVPTNPEDEGEEEKENVYIDAEAFLICDSPYEAEKRSPESSTLVNAFQLIAMSSWLDLSGFFEKEDVSQRKMRFTCNHSAKDLIAKIDDIGTAMGFRVQKKNGKLKVIQDNKAHRRLGGLSVAVEVFEINPSLHVVELCKSYGDSSVYGQPCKKLSDDLALSPGLARGE